ncbi:hypothetical protein ACFVIM_34130 [Streptomyces sp. NPDC057638]|uniref:hypothetical protein n=1 Tax=Streptomyces sp. NPDC057638 TaxID=3346190 RepID=UPI0036A58A58
MITQTTHRDDTATHVLTRARTTAPAVAAAIDHIGTCPHLPRWTDRTIQITADLDEHRKNAHTFHTAVSTTPCSCHHGIPEHLLADVARRWADTLDAGIWYGQSAHRSSPEVREHSRHQYEQAVSDIRHYTDWITSGTAAQTIRGSW